MDNKIAFTIAILIIFAGLLILTGCGSTKEVYIDRYIDVRCDIITPNLSPLTEKPSENIRNLIIYTNQLECLLELCKTGEFTKECKGEEDD